MTKEELQKFFLKAFAHFKNLVFAAYSYFAVSTYLQRKESKMCVSTNETFLLDQEKSRPSHNPNPNHSSLNNLILQNNQTTQAALINPHPGLIGWWNFDEGSGTIAGDMSGNGNIGTVNGATWVSGKYETALIFDGATNYVNVPATNMLTGSLSQKSSDCHFKVGI